jgi:hypothetical protein
MSVMSSVSGVGSQLSSGHGGSSVPWDEEKLESVVAVRRRERMERERERGREEAEWGKKGSAGRSGSRSGKSSSNSKGVMFLWLVGWVYEYDIFRTYRKDITKKYLFAQKVVLPKLPSLCCCITVYGAPKYHPSIKPTASHPFSRGGGLRLSTAHCKLNQQVLN